MDQILSALIFPALLVMLFARITYNRYVALVLMVILIAASAKLGYTHTWPVIIADAISMVVGFIFAKKMLVKRQDKDTDW
ncbi:CsbA family protein [Listeria ilorinensis]|uniref:CsbA family protein n=1 Tax=Listeria ilorinensis TaxID=2867439 RepID=UPI001EF68562|nr:CsbA family protein [Listeria ilorinensis]